QAVVEVDDRFRAPKLLLQFLPANDFPWAAQQDRQQLERLALQLDPDAALAQFTGPEVGFKDAKPDFRRVERGLFKHGTSLAYHSELTFQKALHVLGRACQNSCDE